MVISYLPMIVKDDVKDNKRRSSSTKNNNIDKVLQMFLDYSESDTPYISRTYISEILGIPVNKVTTILNNLINQNKIKYDPETNKYSLKYSNNYKH